jgi:hypothetical protein
VLPSERWPAFGCNTQLLGQSLIILSAVSQPPMSTGKLRMESPTPLREATPHADPLSLN